MGTNIAERGAALLMWSVKNGLFRVSGIISRLRFFKHAQAAALENSFTTTVSPVGSPESSRRKPPELWS
jgi:hypothetical protein